METLKEKCINTSGSDAAYTRVVAAAETLKLCIKNVVLEAQIDILKSQLNHDSSSSNVIIG